MGFGFCYEYSRNEATDRIFCTCKRLNLTALHPLTWLSVTHPEVPLPSRGEAAGEVRRKGGRRGATVKNSYNLSCKFPTMFQDYCQLWWVKCVVSLRGNWQPIFATLQRPENGNFRWHFVERKPKTAAAPAARYSGLMHARIGGKRRLRGAAHSLAGCRDKCRLSLFDNR